MKAQRLRFRYRLTSAASDLRQRDIVDAWEKAAKDGGLAVTHSEGKRANALISLAAPLPQGVTSDCELIDIYMEEAVNPRKALCAVGPHMPAGIEAVDVTEVGTSGASLQSQLRWAEYDADVSAEGLAVEEVEAAIERLLGATTLPVEYRREAKVRAYDLRPLVLDVRVVGSPAGVHRLRMKLRAEPEHTARADQVIAALGLPEALRVNRLRLQVDETPAGIIAYRRFGEMQGFE